MAPGKPKVVGILSLITAAITLIAIPLLDSDPATVPNYSAFLALILPNIGLLFARDSNLTSEQVGAK